MKNKRMVLTDKHGNKLDIPVRPTLPLTAERVRNPGFKQETLILKKGSIRYKGAMPLSCEILMERDVEIILRDGTKIYTDVFRPVDNNKHSALLAYSSYGKELGGQWIDDIPGRSGVHTGATSGLHKFEAPDPAYWVHHDYAVVNPDIRGANMSEGVILFLGISMHWKVATLLTGLPSNPGVTKMWIDVLIWPMGMYFKKGQTMHLTISAYKTPKVDGPMSSMFGSAKISVPKEGYTYMPGTKVKIVALGGNSKEIQADAERKKLPSDVNHGRHAIYSGGQYKSYLYLPIIPKRNNNRRL